MEEQIIWRAQPKQSAFISCPADDVGFGGARGGGKSDAVCGDWLSHEKTYGKDAIGLAFRRERTQLVELIERAKQIFLPIGHRWQDQDKMFRGPHGGRLRFSYLESDSDADAYQGHSYSRLYPEEMGTFANEGPINKLQATLRSGNGVPCQMKGTCNPGGAGHQWVRSRYRLDTHPRGYEIFPFTFRNPFNGRSITKTRIFIPSRVGDNQYLGDDYVANLFQVGSPNLVRAWIDGDWSVIEGAYFPEWADHKHVCTPFYIPDHWLRFRSMDWGSAKPFSIGWWAVAGENHFLDGNRKIPRESLIRYREWYGCEKDKPNTGLRLTAEQIAQGILEREESEKERRAIRYGVIDPSAFTVDSGPSIAERLNTIFSHKATGFHRADNKRVGRLGGPLGGWDIMRQRLVGDGTDPTIFFFSTCRDSIRTIPALQHDMSKPEDLDSEGEDHAADEARYACMSRPWVPAIIPERKTKHTFELHPDGVIRSSVTVRELIDRQAKRNRRRRRVA